jgi:hypothetical protein
VTDESANTTPRNVNTHIIALGKKFHSDIEALTHVTKHITVTQTKNKSVLDGTDETLQNYLAHKGVLEFVIPGVTDKPDWSEEPAETIQQLCDRLCGIIEQTYDEIIIGYSGGTDSETIAQYFLKRGTRNVTLLKRPQELWPGDNVGRTEHHFDPAMKWADRITHDAIKTNYAWAFKNLGWKMRFVEHMTPYDENQYEKSLVNREFLSWENDYSNISSWAQNSGNVFKTKGKRSCFIEGLEKPRIILHNGWYKFHMNHDSQWWGQPLCPPGCDRIWFWLQGLVPEVIQKLAHLKAKEIKKWFAEQGATPTTDEVNRCNDNVHPTRMRTLEAMNMKGICQWHYTAAATYIEAISSHFGPLEFIPTPGKDYDWKHWEISDRSLKKHQSAVNKMKIRDTFYDQMILPNIHHRFLNKDDKTLHGISTKMIPVIPATESDDR